MWNCPQCRESIEDDFDVCWKCGTSRWGDRDPKFQSADEISSSETALLPVIDSHEPVEEFQPPAVQWNRRLIAGALAVTLCLLLLVAWLTWPKSAADFYEIGLVHLQRQQYSEAVHALSRSLELLEDEEEPVNPREIYVARAVAYNNMAKYEEALEDISRAIELIPPSVNGVLLSSDVMLTREEMLYLVRANALIGLGKNQQAIADVHLVLEKDPNNKKAQELMVIAREDRRNK